MMYNNQKIPEGWSVKKLGECFSFLKTSSYSRAETTDCGDVHYIHYGDIHTKYPLHIFTKDINIYISTEQASKSDYLKTGDLILLDASEDYEGTTRCVELLNISDDEKIVSGLHTLALRDTAQNFINGFRAYITSTPFVRNNFWKQVTGIKVYGVSKDNLKKIKLLLPPLCEQEKIAEILGTWDLAIEKLTALIEQKKLLKKGLMQRLLTGKQRLPGFSTPWNKVKLGEMGKFVSGGTPDTEKSEYWNGDIIWLTPSEITKLTNRFVSDSERKITKEGLKNSSAVLLPVRSLIVCTRATVGDCCINIKEVSTNQGFKNLIPENSNIDFLYYLISSHKIDLIRKACGSTFLEISKHDIERLKYCIPPLPEQKAIADILSKADEEITLLTRKLSALKEQKTGLMQQLLTGKIRVKVA